MVIAFFVATATSTARGGYGGEATLPPKSNLGFSVMQTRGFSGGIMISTSMTIAMV